MQIIYGPVGVVMGVSFVILNSTSDIRLRFF